ncbi:MAG: deoxyribonuclease IV [Parcubacteria group bacterium]
MNIGCHVSIAGGIFNAPERAADLGAECFQIFTRSPQGGKAPELTPEVLEKFSAEMKKHKLENFVVHTPYYINFVSANNRVRYGSVSVVRDELERASLLGARFVMTHLGSAGDLDEKEATAKTAEMIAKTLDGYTGSTELLIENAAGAGHIMGATFSQIAEIIRLVNHPKLNGICMDTQHSFASGYDWRKLNDVRTGRDLSLLEQIDQEIGLKKIKLIHANDSLTECGSKKDRHAHIGEGLIGADAFQNIVAFAEKNNIDMILETEHGKVVEDIELLKSFRAK